MSKEDAFTMKGASGTSYSFDVYPKDMLFKPLGAIYSILRKIADGRYYVIYIGQTGYLDEQFDNHHRADCFAHHGSTHIGLHLECDEKARLCKEDDLMDNYKPPCNKT